MSELTIQKKKKEDIESINRFAEEYDSIREKDESIIWTSIVENLMFDNKWRKISPIITFHYTSKTMPEKQVDTKTKPDNKVLNSVKTLETKIEDLEKNFDKFTKYLDKRLIRIEEMICDENDSEVIEIKDYSYDKARKIIEKHLKKAKRKVSIEEFIYEFGIDLPLVNKIYTDLLREGKVE